MVYSQNALLLQKTLKHKETIYNDSGKYGLDFDFGTGYRDLEIIFRVKKPYFSSKPARAPGHI